MNSGEVHDDLVPSRLTIGMATYRDFDGLYFTINALRLYHAEVLPRCELLVVDNDPSGPHGERSQQFIEHVATGIAKAGSPRQPGTLLPAPFSVRYIPFDGTQGTSAPRDLIFQEAAGDAVLVIDSHVDLWPGAVSRLLDYFDQHPESQDLLQGPLVMDNLAGEATHFDDVWRGGMWGTWGTAWRKPEGLLVATRETSNRQVGLFDLQTGQPLEELPISWYGHEARLLDLGFQQATSGHEPFEIPAQGLGLFACRRAAWLGFNAAFREFGGEEWYIHTKFRQAGHRCLCLPWLKWVHRFADPAAGRHYLRTNPGKIRNYILGHQELGLPLDRIRRHFVEGLSEDPVHPEAGGGKMSAEAWNWLAEHPADYPIQLPTPPAVVSQQNPTELERLYQHAVRTPSDINQHCRKLRTLASECDCVVEFGHRPDVSTVAILAGQPRRFVTVSPTAPMNFSLLRAHCGRTQLEHIAGDSLSVSIPVCDLLFIDTKHTAAHLWLELTKHVSHCTRYIVLHDTQIYGRRGEDGTPGLIASIRRLVEERPAWSIVFHTSDNHGLTVLSCREADKPPHAIRLWPIGSGPGTELKAILASLGINPAATCDCHGRSLQMDQWGLEGCRQRRETIIQWLRDGQARWGWQEKLAAAAKAVTTGLAFKLNPLDPFPALVDEAIRRAELRANSGKEVAP